MKKQNKIILCIVGSILGLLIATIGIAYYYTNYLLGGLTYIEIQEQNIGIRDDIKEELSKYDNSIINVLLFGIDNADGGNGRSDSIMIATLDTINDELKLSSIMRDAYVEIEGYGMDKLNHAYSYGTAELAMNTINSNFDLNITDFVAVDLEALPEVIDLLDGVEIEIQEDEVEHMSGIDTPGIHNLTGKQALKYTRIRDTVGDDYKRTERQRNVLEAVVDKALTIDITRFPSLLAEALPMIETNLRSNEILELAYEVIKIGNVPIRQERFPTNEYLYDMTLDGIYYMGFEREETIDQMHTFIFEKYQPPIEYEDIIESEWFIDSEDNIEEESAVE